MPNELLHIHVAEQCLNQLRDRADIMAVVDEARNLLGDRRDLLGSMWDEILRVVSQEAAEPLPEFPEFLIRVYRFAVGLGVAYDWRRGIVDGARGLSHLLIDVAHDPARALAELSAIEEHLFSSDPSAWAGIKGDMGIAMLWLKRAKEAVTLLAVPCALEGVLVSVEDAALYRGNLGLALASDGLLKEARNCLQSAINAATMPELIEKFTADLRRIDKVAEMR